MKKILIAEDDAALATAYHLKMTKSDFEVKIVRDGDELLNSVVGFMPDLILLDLVMPKKDGFTVLTTLKADEHLKNIPVIIASNLGQKEEIDKGMALGANDFIVKSDISLTDVINKINAVLSPQTS